MRRRILYLAYAAVAKVSASTRLFSWRCRQYRED